jgi:hypothetical protein
MYVFAATFWTFDVAFFVFRKSKDYFKWLLAIFAVELIARHWDLRKNVRAAGLLIYGVRSRIAGVKASSYLEGGQLQLPVSVNQMASIILLQDWPMLMVGGFVHRVNLYHGLPSTPDKLRRVTEEVGTGTIVFGYVTWASTRLKSRSRS